MTSAQPHSRQPSSSPAPAVTPRRRIPTHPRPVIAHHVEDVVLSIAGHTVKGRFTPSNLELRVLTRPWAGAVFRTPAAAADAVAAYFGAGRGTLGTPRWHVAATGLVLRAPTSAHRDAGLRQPA
ncbi:hypothetical protein OEB99_00115 [Actinotalea sp. M2MS4P-6]|uniref:hypothetical protein n=1 Tax=Actinotalea sp. M2MS4P-6 TaxID=2983762 RepID=UPI0021E3AD8E|nr:hypothetical protein [Actinotalea sp. M2MS4P-6]MCV2392701.1 hypothetical protein [Actinotalea sp. M2MS4P-6]